MGVISARKICSMKKNIGSPGQPSGPSLGLRLPNSLFYALMIARCTTMQVYDLAWSPSGEYIISGSTDNAARVFASHDGVFSSLSSSSVAVTRVSQENAYTRLQSIATTSKALPGTP